MSTSGVDSVEAQLRHAIDRIHIDLPDQCNVVERARALVWMSPSKPAQCLILESEPLLGKTRVLDLISGDIRSQYVSPIDGWTCRAECESFTDGSALGAILCRALNIPHLGFGNMTKLSGYITGRIRKHERKPVLLVIDNAHLLLDDEGTFKILGGIVGSGIVPILLSGRTGTALVGRRLLDMVGHFMEREELSPLPYAEGKGLKLVRDFCLVIEQELSPILDQLGIILKLDSDVWAKRLGRASFGSQGIIVELIRETLITTIKTRAIARRNTKHVIKYEDFAEIWRMKFAPNSTLKFNPFKRDDPPTLGEVQDALAELETRKKPKPQLPVTPAGKGARIWR